MYLPTPTENIAATQADLKERLRVARQKQDQFHEGMALLDLGSLARSCSDLLGAEESFKMALACFNAIQNTNYQGETLNLLAALEQERGNAEAALTYYRRVLVEFGPEAEIPARGVTLLEIGSLIYEYGNVPVARKWFEEALAFFRAHHETVGEIRTRLCLSQVHEAQSNFDAAENEARSAMLLASDHKAFSLACQARSALGRLIGLRSPGMGIELLQEALEVARREGLTEVERTCRVALAEAHRRLGDLESAYRALVDAYASERTSVRAERARYQAYLACIKVITPRGEQATVASSLESLRALLKEGTLAERTLGIARIEIDHVKELRERFGDARLNAIRERVVTLLQLSLRSGDILARHGTDEFVIALRGATPRQARRIAERLRNAVGTADWMNLGEELAVTLSIGLCIGASGIDPEAVIQAADRCLDDARSSGRNQIAVGRAAA